MHWPTSDSEIVSLILQNEGGYINRSDDMGGPTNMGITIDTLASWRKTPVTDADIQSLTIQEASEIYGAKYIAGPNFDQLSDIKLRACMADFGVLCGPVLATQSLQAILKQPQDGILGQNSLAAANALPDSRPARNQLSGARIGHHADVVTRKPDQLPFLKGWLARALCFIE